MSYSQFIAGLHAAGIEVDRKVLADLAVTDDAAFAALVGAAAKAWAPGAEPSDASAPPRSRFARSIGARSAHRRFAATGGPLTPSPSPTPRSSGCGASSGAAVRVRTRARSSSRGRRCWPRRSTAACRSRRCSWVPARWPSTAAGAPVYELAPGVVERVASTVSPQPVLAVVSRTDVAAGGPVGAPSASWSWPPVSPIPATWARSCARPRQPAPQAVVLTAGSVDLFNPKVVRASAGALFHVPVVVDVPLAALGELGVPLLGAVAAGGVPYDEAPLDAPVRPRARQRGPRVARWCRAGRARVRSRTPGGPRASTWPWRRPSVLRGGPPRSALAVALPCSRASELAAISAPPGRRSGTATVSSRRRGRRT